MIQEYEHFMLKEIFEQPARLRDTITHGAVRDEAFGESASAYFLRSPVQILACAATMGWLPDTG